MKIRKFKAKDAEQCNKIINNVLDKGGRNMPEKAIKKIKAGSTPQAIIKKSKTRQYFVCENKREIIAIGGLKGKEVVKMYTALKHQGRGIGSKILKKIENYAKKKKIGKLFLYTSNPKVIRFYEKNGFNIIKKTRDRDKNIDAFYMEKELK